ncbi:hypothetical protein GCM10017556_49850 [Micromonospora sagamiensis]|nr:hypothetical protein GCM10017556_49850 [Micromonospora sagamiensis]
MVGRAPCRLFLYCKVPFLPPRRRKDGRVVLAGAGGDGVLCVAVDAVVAGGAVPGAGRRPGRFRELLAPSPKSYYVAGPYAPHGRSTKGRLGAVRGVEPPVRSVSVHREPGTSPRSTVASAPRSDQAVRVAPGAPGRGGGAPPSENGQ